MLFDLPMFTSIHVVISVLGIITGLVVLGGLMAGARPQGWTLFFLVTTLLTSVTGFGLPLTNGRGAAHRRCSFARSARRLPRGALPTRA